jgi:Helicase conserved C-terminal domain
MMERWPDVVFVGLTATPGTKGLGKIWDDLVTPTSTNDLIAAGLLSDSRTFAHSHPDLSGIATVAGDYHEGQLSERMQKPTLVADTVDCLKKFRGGRPTLVFCVDRAHAQVVFEKLCDAGIHAVYVDQYTPREEREKIRQRMEHGEVEVTVNIGCLTTGTDWPFISCIVLARPTKSKMLFKQIIGRGLRTYPGKDYCLILDQSDSTQRLGFASDIEWDHLDDGNPNRSAAKKKEPAEPRECVECHALIPPATRACPECGHTFKVISPIRIGKGELTEVKRGEKKQKHTMATKQIWWSGFLHYAAQRNKNRKWCLAQYKQKFGVIEPRRLAAACPNSGWRLMFGFRPSRNACRLQWPKAHERAPASLLPEQSRRQPPSPPHSGALPEGPRRAGRGNLLTAVAAPANAAWDTKAFWEGWRAQRSS